MTPEELKPLYHFWTPNYWPTWLGLGLLRLTCLLPYRWQLGLGKALGRLGHRLSPERRAVARRNIELCFPELSSAERDALARAHFESLGASLMEMALGRWASDRKLEKLTTVTGTEHVNAAFEQGHGVVLITAHFTTLEISGRILKRYIPPMHVLYRRFRSPFATAILATNRLRSVEKVIEKNDVKTMVRSLRSGNPVWYAPDQSYNRKQSAPIPFFGIPAMTNTALNSLAKLGNAVVVPYFSRRMPEGGYEIRALPPLDGVPSDDPVEDMRRYHAVLEQQVRRCPEQYYWVHRRFKDRPGDLPDVYADLDALK